jgi:hypothetical protein
LLAAASPDASPESLANLSIGERDARLLALRVGAFGSQLSAVTNCPSCQERVEIAFPANRLRLVSKKHPDSLSLELAGFQLRFRLPNSRDLAAIADCPDVPAARQALFERCLLEARQDGEPRAASQIPPELVDAVAERMSRTDPRGDIQFALSCPGCSHQWTASFDIAAYLWSEINAWAPRVLREVHTLASAYGWSESDILAMSAWRRQWYLRMASG